RGPAQQAACNAGISPTPPTAFGWAPPARSQRTIATSFRLAASHKTSGSAAAAALGSARTEARMMLPESARRSAVAAAKRVEEGLGLLAVEFEGWAEGVDTILHEDRPGGSRETARG